MNSEEGGVSLLRRRPRREASGVLPRIPCFGLTFFPPSLPLRPPSSVLLSFLSRHWTENVLVCGPRKPRKRGRPTAIRRGKGRCRKRRGKRREGGREEGTSEEMEEEGATTTKVKSKFLPRQGAQRGRPCPSNSDGCGGGGGGGGGGVRNAKPKHYPIYRTATAAEEEEEREGTRPIIENTREGRDGKDDFSPLQASCLPPVCLSYP